MHTLTKNIKTELKIGKLEWNTKRNNLAFGQRQNDD